MIVPQESFFWDTGLVRRNGSGDFVVSRDEGGTWAVEGNFVVKYKVRCLHSFHVFRGISVCTTQTTLVCSYPNIFWRCLHKCS